MKKTGEVTVDLCFDHKDCYLEDVYRGYVFNSYITFPAKACNVPGCLSEAFYTLIGVHIPNTVGELKIEPGKYRQPVIEIFTEARKMLHGFPALERLSKYVYTRILPSDHRSFLAGKMCNKMASLVLEKLKIDPSGTLSDRMIHDILIELNLYPDDRMN